jgi:hypothetical protein
MSTACRYLWALPASLVGGAFAAIAAIAGARIAVVDGIVEATGGRLLRALASRSPFVAITVGHVVLAGDVRSLAACRTHERVHVRQYERYGAAFFVLYAGSSLWQLVRGGHPYRDNVFERQARELAQ